METKLLDQQIKKLDHFNDVKRQMNAAAEKRAILQRKVGQKLVHCKLKGHEDVAEEFKRLIRMKSEGSFYAVKEAQMQPLVANGVILPSKAVQTRIDTCEREIFSLLSSDTTLTSDYTEKCDVEIDLSNCLVVLNTRNDNLQIKLEELAAVEAELGEQEPYNEEGFHERDVRQQESLQKEKEELEMELGMAERNVQQTFAKLDESKVMLREAKAKITTLEEFNASQRKAISNARKAQQKARVCSSKRRDVRNEVLCRVLLQRRALHNDNSDQQAEIAATESLHSRKSDIENEIEEKEEKLRMLKMKFSDLDNDERSLEIASRTCLTQLAQMKETNYELDTRISDMRMHNACLSRDLETCSEDVTKERDPTCTIWRDRVLRNLFQAGLLDINHINNVSFSNKSKYKFPTEQYQIIQALKPELGMLQAGITDLKDKISNVKSEIESLKGKTSNEEKHRAEKQSEYKKLEHMLSRTKTKASRLEELLRTTTKATDEQVKLLVETLPKANMLEKMGQRQREILGRDVLQKLQGKVSPNEDISRYNQMKEEILTMPGKYPKETEYEFLQQDWRYQLQLEKLLVQQLCEIHGVGLASSEVGN